MKRKVFVAIFCALLLGAAIALPVWAAGGAQDVSWATLSYVYDPDVEGETPKSGNISFTEGEETRLERLSTVSWDAARADLYLNGELCEGTAVRIERAGEYELRIKNKENGQEYSCTVIMLAVIRADGEYFSVNPQTWEFDPVMLARFPVIECLNAERAELDGKPMNMTGELVDTFGEHSLRVYSGNIRVAELNFRVLVCTVERVYIGASDSGVNCLKLTVGEFPRAVEVFLDGSTTPLSPGVTEITTLGQHTLRAKVDGAEVSAASGVLPKAAELCLQFEIYLPSAEFNEPIELLFVGWNATFYVNGKAYSGENCRITKAGENVIWAVDENGEKIEKAFYLRTETPSVGNVCDEVVLVFHNWHYIYAIVLIVFAAVIVVAAAYFFLKRRSIV